MKGDDAVTVDSNRLTLNKQMTDVVVILKHTYRLGNQSISLFSQPTLLSEVIIDDTEPVETDTPTEPTVTEPETSGPIDTPDTDATTPVGGVDTDDVIVSVDTAPAKEKGCASSASGISLVLLITVLMLSAHQLSKKEYQQ